MEFRRKSSLAAIILLLFCAHGWADTIFLPLTDDAFINGQKADRNEGDRFFMTVHTYGPKYALVRFDVSSLVGQTFSNATLTLYLKSLRQGGVMHVCMLDVPWNEATVTFNNLMGGCKPNFKLIELRPFDVGSTVSIGVADFVGSWVGGTSPNYGFMLYAQDGIYAYFETKEEPRFGGLPASLTVDTAPPSSSSPMVTRIPILEGSVVLGDPPRSTFWETTTEILSGAIEAAKTAHIGLYTTNNSLGRLVINGQVVQLPHVELTDNYNQWRPQLGQTLLSIPLGYLQPGANTIRFETGIGNWTPENVYDDYTFGDVEIILSLR